MTLVHEDTAQSWVVGFSALGKYGTICKPPIPIHPHAHAYSIGPSAKCQGGPMCRTVRTCHCALSTSRTARCGLCPAHSAPLHMVHPLGTQQIVYCTLCTLQPPLHTSDSAVQTEARSTALSGLLWPFTVCCLHGALRCVGGVLHTEHVPCPGR